MLEERPANKWIVSNNSISEAEKLASRHGLSKILARLLVNRNVTSDREVEIFLNPAWESIHDPYQLCGINKGVERIAKAIASRERILVYGDYDVDGVTSVALLCEFLRGQGAEVDFLIPDRFEDGYGLSFDALKKQKTLFDLIITVDCGINSREETAWLNEQGVDVIITDHHVQVGELPPALTVINPKRNDCLYSFKELSGVGVAFKLVWAIMKYYEGEDVSIERLKPYLDLVALGTIADLVPLVEENRFFVMEGLKDFGTKRLGLKALLEKSGLAGENSEINVGHIAFVIAPRINAAGRLKSADEAVYLLMEEYSRERALARAAKLDRENKERQKLEREVYEEAKEKILSQGLLETDYVLVLVSDKWHEGVIGIAASKLVEEFYRPVILLSINNTEAKGSCRGIKPFDIISALRECKEDLKKFGGHKAAAGLTLEASNVETFRQKINEYAKIHLKPSDLTPSLDVDMVVPCSYVNYELAEEIQKLEPYGIGNPRPVIASTFKLQNLRRVGKDKNHIKLSLSDGSFTLDGIWFDGTDKLPFIKGEAFTKIAFTPKINSNSRSDFDLQVKDLKYEKSKDCIIDYRNYSKKNVLATLGSKQKIVQERSYLVLVNTSKSKDMLNSLINSKYRVASFNDLPGLKDDFVALILFDLPFDGEYLREYVKNNSLETVFLLYGNEDQRKNKTLWDASIPGYHNLSKIFEMFVEISREKRLTEEEIKKYFKANFLPGITWRLIEKSKDIFLELGIIKESSEGDFVNTTINFPTLEEDLKRSATYKEECSRLQKILKWERFFLEAPTPVIFQLMFEDEPYEIEWVLL